MTITTKIVAAAAAAVVAGGVATGVLMTSSDNTAADDLIIRLELPDVDMCRVDPITLELPELPDDTLEDPAAGLADALKLPDSSDLADTSDLLASLKVALPELTLPDVSAITLSDPGDLREMIRICKLVEATFPDKDNREWHGYSDEQLKAFAAWIDIYRAYDSSTAAKPAVVKMPSGVRMISFAQRPETPENAQILRHNIEYYKSCGYNAILVALNDITHLNEDLAFIRELRVNYGLRVWAAYAPSGEGVNAPPTFLPPDAYSVFLRTIAPELDGWLLAYRRTGVHLFAMDPPYIDFVVRNLRKGNAALPILGEFYYGYNYRFRSDHTAYWSGNTFAEASADAVQNRGYLSVDPATVLRRMSKPAVIFVQGPRPLWIETTKLSFAAAQKAKVRIEKAWLTAGALGTITEHGDGLHKNNMAEFPAD